jgi:3-oxoacyl-[acyl-carrier protein] reductase
MDHLIAVVGSDHLGVTMGEGLDLGIAGRKAIVCGSSKGLGKACAFAMARVGVEVVLNARTEEALKSTAEELGELVKRRIQIVAADVSSGTGRQELLRQCPDPDILINNAGGPPPGDFRGWNEAEWGAALSANMVAPILLTRAVIDSMIARKWGRIINITSGAVKAPLPLLGLSNGARTGLTGFMAGLAREVAPHGVTINNMLPGNFATDRLRSYASAMAEKQGISLDEMWKRLSDVNPSKRIGQPEEFGSVCAFLVSRHAGYITGQNILLDGGAYPGVF